MKKSDVSRLRELVDLCEGDKCYRAWLTASPSPYWGLIVQLDDEILRFLNVRPWAVEDWPQLRWEGDYFFHRVYLEDATITGLTAKQVRKGFDRYRSLQQSKKTLAFPGIMELVPFDLVYLVEGTMRSFGGPIYRPRLRAFKKMVQWAMPEAETGFTVLHTVSKHWGYVLVSPWLIKSIDPVWLRRLKMFQALNEYDPTHWPMSLLIEKWSDFREIRF